MKKYKQIIIALLVLCSCPGTALSASLDELYRDIIRSENKGYLPLFVKNREIPDILVEKEGLKNIPATPQEDTSSATNTQPIKLTNDRAYKDMLSKLYNEKWHQVLLAVQENRVTPMDLDEIRKRVSLNDPKAVEVYAWMHAKGVGVKNNLPEAFLLYQKAQSLNVPKAKDNALQVYRAMTPDQRAQIKNSAIN